MEELITKLVDLFIVLLLVCAIATLGAGAVHVGFAVYEMSVCKPEGAET